MGPAREQKSHNRKETSAQIESDTARERSWRKAKEEGREKGEENLASNENVHRYGKHDTSRWAVLKNAEGGRGKIRQQEEDAMLCAVAVCLLQLTSKIVRRGCILCFWFPCDDVVW